MGRSDNEGDPVAELDARLATALGPGLEPAEPWGDSPAKRAKRETWNELGTGGAGDWAMLAKTQGVHPGIVETLVRFGALRFAAILEFPAAVFVSSCGRHRLAFRVDGGRWWMDEHGFRDAIWFPGSLRSVPFGLGTMTPGGAVAVVCGPLALPPLVSLMRDEDRMEVGAVAFPAPDFDVCPALAEALAGRRVRIFPPMDGAWRRAARRWADALRSVGCEVDALDVAACGVRDLRALAAIPAAEREWEVMP